MDNYNDASRVIDGNFDGAAGCERNRAVLVFGAVLCCVKACSTDTCASYGLSAGCVADPRLTDYELLLQNISDLKAGRVIQVGSALASVADSAALL